jgi:hypothetical protein
MLALPAHDRYDYSPIDKRRDFNWPEVKLFMLLSMSSISPFSLVAVMIQHNAAALHKLNAITLGATTDYVSGYGASSGCSIR